MTARTRNRVWVSFVSWACGAALLGCVPRAAAQLEGTEVPPAKPTTPYQIRLGQREAQAVPQKTRHSQTGGGSIEVKQTAPNVVVITMRGAAVAGGNFKPGAAALAFTLEQDFCIVPTRPCQRPPRLGLAGRLIGTLASSEQTALGSGSAEQGSASAIVCAAGENLLDFAIPSQGVVAGQKTFLNKRSVPVDAVVTPGKYQFRQTFQIAAAQPWNLCHKASVADFDPNPQLDPEWHQALKTFRAVPRPDFGFRVVLWVVEEPDPTCSPEKPAPSQPEGK